MDLHITGAEPTEDERDAVDGLLGVPASGWDGGSREMERDGRVARSPREAGIRRDQLLPAFHAVQDAIGWVSHGALNYICRRLSVPPAEAWGVLTFYHLLAHEPRPALVAHVCDDIACRLKGVEGLCLELDRSGLDWRRSPCLGQCDRAPAALILGAGTPAVRVAHAPVASVADLADAMTRVRDQLNGQGSAEQGEESRGAGLGPPEQVEGQGFSPGRNSAGSLSRRELADLRGLVPQAGSPDLKLLARIGTADPTSLDDYRAHGGYRALTRAIGLGPDGMIAELTASNLLGRGGAAFPTGRKWAAVAGQPARPHYVVCNADESEPGTFKDRVLMTGDPFAIVEAMTICGLATVSERGFIYIRGEYPLSEARIANAVAQARAAGLLGVDVAGAGFAFDIEVRRGAGAYICGEETALFNSVEGLRGEPRSKPPFPAEIGLFGKPTLVNNVETLAHVLGVINEGGSAWAKTGTPASTGTRLFCLSGHVARPGLYELPMGVTLGEILELAGGVAGGRPLRAVLLGGAAGMFVGPERLEMKMTFEDVRAAGATLGSGVVMPFDDTTDFADILTRIARFFEDESCGQCVPCRVGAVRQRELLARLSGRTDADRNGSLSGEMVLLAELGQAMRDASICGLGQTASSAIESAVRLGVLTAGGPS